MTAGELLKEQERLHQKIDEIATKFHLLESGKETIKDGVNDIPAYVASPIKLMWILKEPWEVDDDGEVGNGGWNLYSLFDSIEAWRIKTYKAMAYVKYGMENNVYWEDMQQIKKDASLIHILKNIAYLNINKMPAATASPDDHMWECTKIWKPLVEEQISVYNPDVIIYGGTANFLMPHSELSEDKCIKKVYNEGWHSEIRASVYRYNGRWIITARHPSRYNEVYIDTLIGAIQYVKEQIINNK